jgi:hypothetical protein
MKLETIAKQQARALKGTLELIEREGLSDSEMRALIGSLERWLDHVKPWRVSA